MSGLLRVLKLVGISKTTHAAHHTEDVVVDSKHTQLGGGGHGGNEVHVEGGSVDARHVAGAGGLVLLGLEGERVDVDTSGGHVLVVLVRLHQVEVAAIALGHAVVTVELQLGNRDGVLAGAENDGGLVGNSAASSANRHGVGIGALAGVGEVEPLLAGLHVVGGIGAGVGDHAVGLDDPHQLGDRVVQGQLALVLQAGDRLLASVLELLNKVLVRGLRKPPPLVGVEVDVVDVERSSLHARSHQGLDSGPLAGGLVTRPVAVGNIAELDVDLDFVVLQGNKGQRQAGVAVEEELQRHIQNLALDGLGGGSA